MFKEAIEVIKESFHDYFGYFSMFIVFVLAIIFMLSEEKEKENRKFLIYYTLLIFAIILNPIFEIIFSPVLYKDIYFRVFWLIPFGIIIAYFGANLSTKQTNKILNFIIAICFCGVIIYSGQVIYSNRTFERVDNFYKVPDEVIEIVEIVNKTPFKSKSVMAPVKLNIYIRQYDATIYQAYVRNSYGDYSNCEILKYYENGDVENLCNLCKKQNVNIIVYDKNIPLTISPNYFGYKDFAQTEEYIIYILEE